MCGLPPSKTRPPLQVLSLHLPLPSPLTPICFQSPALSLRSLNLPTQSFTLASFKECGSGGISPSLKGVPSQNPGEEAAAQRTEKGLRYTALPRPTGNSSSEPGAGGREEGDVCVVSSLSGTQAPGDQ